MTCEEFLRVLPDILEDGQTAEQEAHRRSCSTCSNLASDLSFISQQARLLRACDEPSPRVWNSIEMALREQGLVRQPQNGLAVVPSPGRRWSLAWLVPLAAMFLLTFGLVDYYRASRSPVASQPSQSALVAANVQSGARRTLAMSASDEQMLEAVALSVPAMRATYAATLEDVNAYIRDAEASAQSDPNDEEAQQSLMEAYAQKNMVYEMALEPSLR